MDGCPFHSTSLDTAKWTWEINACWSKCKAHVTNPAFSWHFSQANTSLMKADVAHATKDDQIIVCVVSVSANLAFGIFILPLFLFFLPVAVIFNYFLFILLFSVGFHVLEVLLLLLMKLENKLKGIFSGNRHKVFGDFWQLNCGDAGLENANDFVKWKLENAI